MWQRFTRWWINRLFGPPNRRMFMLRIRGRVLKLRFRLWWRRPKAAVIRHHWPKPVTLILVGLLVPTMTVWLLSLLFPAEAAGLAMAFHNLLTKPEQFRLEWREAAQLLLLLVGVPSAFLLWLFRDINVSGTLENQRKDVNLKEFQEIQMRAAGAMDETLPNSARETLQIAALHQLRAFLRGEYGPSFRRPAFELLHARLTASADATGMAEVHKWLHDWRFGKQDDLLKRIRVLPEAQREVLFRRRGNTVAEAERTIIMEEWEAICRSGFPLTGFSFSTVRLSDGQLLAGLPLIGAQFIGAMLNNIHLEGAQLFGSDFAFAELYRAHLEGANLAHSYFEGASGWEIHLEYANLSAAKMHGVQMGFGSLHGANLDEAHLQGANLAGAKLPGARLVRARLEAANLSGADLKGADLSKAHLEGADLYLVSAGEVASCEGASIDHATRFSLPDAVLRVKSWDRSWGSLPEEEKAAARLPWLARGAVMAGPAGTETP